MERSVAPYFNLLFKHSSVNFLPLGSPTATTLLQYSVSAWQQTWHLVMDHKNVSSFICTPKKFFRFWGAKNQRNMLFISIY